MPKTIMDLIGQETLERFSKVDAYSLWQYRAVERYLGQRVMEIGSGIGNISRHLLGRERVLLTDVSEHYLGALEKSFSSRPEVRIGRFDLSSGEPSYHDEKIDSIVCMNVLEHVENDMASLKNLHDTLVPGGRLMLLVPAHQFLFNSLDKALGHFRRYNKQNLTEKLAKTGFKTETIFYFNRLATLGWWWNGNVLKKTLLPSGQLGLFGKLVPFISKLDNWSHLPFGISVIAVAQKPE